MHAFVYLMRCWSTAGSCSDSQGCTCLQLGRGKKHQCPGRAGFCHIFVNPRCQSCASDPPICEISSLIKRLLVLFLGFFELLWLKESINGLMKYFKFMNLT